MADGGFGIVPSYYMNDGAFELPGADFVDHTTHVIDVKSPDHEGLTLVVCRAAFPIGKSLQELARSRVAEELVRLSDYSVLEERETRWADMPAMEYTSRWRHQGQIFYQRQAHLSLMDRWTFLALSGPIESRAPCDACFEQIQTTFRARTDP